MLKVRQRATLAWLGEKRRGRRRAFSGVAILLGVLATSPRLLAVAGGALLFCVVAQAAAAEGPGKPEGMFDGHTDIGKAIQPGKLELDAAEKKYTLAAAGEDIWNQADSFHYVWKQASGDFALEADIAFVGAGKNPHRKACLQIRQSLDADAVHASATLHGDGLTSLQYRDEQGAATHEIQANITAPQRLRIERRGQYVLMFLAGKDEPLRLAAGSLRVGFKDPVYVGLGVCSHDKDVAETAVFSQVKFDSELASSPAKASKPTLYCALETISLASRDRRVTYITKEHIEAPNWMPDGKSLLFNGEGRMQRVPVAGGTPELLDTGSAIRCNNDHGISPDGKLLAISDQSAEPHESVIYVLPLGGGTPKRITEKFPSYWHGWSPDGKTLAFCGQRDGKWGIFTVPIFAAPAAGGDETRLTTADGLDDGPDYSPDGKHIYLNSDRTGRMQIYRMHADGTGAEQLTEDGWNNWFAHPSPDGKTIAFLSFEKDVKGHPPNKDVTLRTMTLEDKKITILTKLFGGQGTINVPSWSPDGKRLAFVSYVLIP